LRFGSRAGGLLAIEEGLLLPVLARMLRLRSEPASPQDGLPGGALRLAGRCALQAPPCAALGCHDGNEGEWKASLSEMDAIGIV